MSKTRIIQLIAGYFILYGIFIAVMAIWGKSAGQKTDLYLWAEQYAYESPTIELEIGAVQKVRLVSGPGFDPKLVSGVSSIRLIVTGDEGEGELVGAIARNQGQFDFLEATFQAKGKEAVTLASRDEETSK